MNVDDVLLQGTIRKLLGEIFLCRPVGAAILAVQMLALSDDALAAQLVQRKKTMAEGVVEKEKKLLAQLEA